MKRARAPARWVFNNILSLLLEKRLSHKRETDEEDFSGRMIFRMFAAKVVLSVWKGWHAELFFNFNTSQIAYLFDATKCQLEKSKQIMGIASTSYIIDIIAPECKKWRDPFEKIGVWKRSKSDALRLGGNAKHRCTSGVQKKSFHKSGYG